MCIVVSPALQMSLPNTLLFCLLFCTFFTWSSVNHRFVVVYCKYSRRFLNHLSIKCSIGVVVSWSGDCVHPAYWCTYLWAIFIESGSSPWGFLQFRKTAIVLAVPCFANRCAYPSPPISFGPYTIAVGKLRGKCCLLRIVLV